MLFLNDLSDVVHASNDLPITLMSLEEWCLVTVQGKDSKRYLQGQLTTDLELIISNKHYYTAHCNAYGKMLSNLILFKYKEGYAYLVRCSVYEKQIQALKKYAQFSEVTINTVDDIIIFGVAGFEVDTLLLNYFEKLPNARHSLLFQDNDILLWFEQPIERYIIITQLSKAINLKNKLIKIARVHNHKQWLSLEIEAGIPILDHKTSGQFIPQAMNMHLLGAISFNKGCYIGQEIIARTTFRKTNKRALYWLAGIANTIPEIGSFLEMKVGNTWIRNGIVLYAIKINNNNVWIQSVINYSLSHDIIFRIAGDTEGKLIVKKLPYSLSKKS